MIDGNCSASTQWQITSLKLTQNHGIWFVYLWMTCLSRTRQLQMFILHFTALIIKGQVEEDEETVKEKQGRTSEKSISIWRGKSSKSSYPTINIWIGWWWWWWVSYCMCCGPETTSFSCLMSTSRSSRLFSFSTTSTHYTRSKQIFLHHFNLFFCFYFFIFLPIPFYFLGWQKAKAVHYCCIVIWNGSLHATGHVIIVAERAEEGVGAVRGSELMEVHKWKRVLGELKNLLSAKAK